MKVKSPLPNKLEQFLRCLEIGCRPLVVAVSGGPDSVALLHALVSGQLPNLIIAHLNHQLRGQDSADDERFVHDLHAVLQTRGTARLELRCQQVDVGAQALRENDNLENVARKIRYGWLAKVAREVHAPFVATGHTADDQAETVLHRLLRGTGLKGLRGIAARRILVPGIELIRPLLGVTRAEVLAYLEEEGQVYREDASNNNRNYTRNRIRHELLPYLVQHYNPAIASILGRLAEQAAQAYREFFSVRMIRVFHFHNLGADGIRVHFYRIDFAPVHRIFGVEDHRGKFLLIKTQEHFVIITLMGDGS